MFVRTENGTLLNLHHAMEISRKRGPYQPPEKPHSVDISVLWIGHSDTCWYRIPNHEWARLMKIFPLVDA